MTQLKHIAGASRQRASHRQKRRDRRNDPSNLAARAEHVEILKAKIKKGLYDEDGLIDGILEEVLRDVC